MLGNSWMTALTPEALLWLLMSSFFGIVIGDNLWLYSLQVIGARQGLALVQFSAG